MSWLNLYDHQKKALAKMHNGCILCGGVGSGKSITALAYYYILQGGNIDTETIDLLDNPCDLIIITTAKKRDSCDWEKEMLTFLLCKEKGLSIYDHNVVVDSWNNIGKYTNVKNAFFIFDEQRVVGSGAWVKAFLKIAQSNKWILLSATPGDRWIDYIPVMVANGFYKNRSAWEKEHVIWKPYIKYNAVDRYVNVKKLRTIRNYLLVDMPMERETVRHYTTLWCDYDASKYRYVMKNRWNPFDNSPIENASEHCYTLRRVVNSDMSRVAHINNILSRVDRVIIFYNFDYELEILRGFLDVPWLTLAEWNGHKHELIPQTKRWAYLVQYTAGAEGWNCTECDTVIFYSQNYSYKIREQASGRIDRINTSYKDLYYYDLVSKAPIDMAINKAIKQKKLFNETRFLN